MKITDKDRLDFIVDFVSNIGYTIEISRSRSGKSIYFNTKRKYQKYFEIYCGIINKLDDDKETIRGILYKAIDNAIMAMKEKDK